MAMNRRLICGLDFSNVNEIKETVDTSIQNRYDFVCIPIVHPRFKREFINGKSKDRPGAFTRFDMILSSHDWNAFVIGKISPYLDCDSEDTDRRKLSEMMLLQELAYSSHLGLSAIMITLTHHKNDNLARIINGKLINNFVPTIWVRIPMVAPSETAYSYRKNKGKLITENTWQMWNKFRSLCNSDRRLGIALEVTSDLPSEDEILRWLGEPIKCIVLSTDIFITNRKGYPVLSKSHQAFIKLLVNMDIQIVVTGARRHEVIAHYTQYLEHLWKTLPSTDSISCYAKGYEDFLQCPLQPLMDNLESSTYEVFERDPVKYSEYQRAIYTALLDRVSDEEKDTHVLVVMVVGAGRGPLVTAAITAATKAERRIKLYAVEKNPNAVVTLQTMQEENWGDSVTIISSDMREWDPPELADILVSELLGSFGDNELSPECLDGAQKFLKEDGISIPCTYTSYLSPIHSPKLHTEARNFRDKDKPPIAFLETPYVVHQQNKYDIAPVQSLFTFNHPNRDPLKDNTRFKSLTFKIKQDAVLHGFAGFFDTVLYKDITLSILPETHSSGMLSWFPIYFPIKEPVHLLAGQELVVHFWRLVSKQNVWYEWTVSQPVPLAIHNPNGRSYTIGL
uniref:Protein arginine N-methyltransferase n=1 Tax=Clastoptera arizonana TaxID=38151 RepID=A0A1B6CEQ6_9HEMI